MDGRFFDGRRVEASLYEGQHKYKKSASGGDHDMGHDMDASEKRRLDAFASWLEKEEIGKSNQSE